MITFNYLLNKAITFQLSLPLTNKLILRPIDIFYCQMVTIVRYEATQKQVFQTT